MSYKVKIDIFEGPFDLLVYLIERQGMNIYDVNISKITDQYMDYVAAMQQVKPEQAAEFMVLAATLMQIKSRMLLPQVRREEGAALEEDPRDELARKIEEYRKYKLLAESLTEREYEGSRYFTKPREDISEYTDEPIENLEVDMNQFIEAFRQFLEKRQRIEDVKKRYQRVARERMTMEAKAESVRAKLISRKRLDFSDLIEDVADTYDVVLTFVTLLEMLKTGMIGVVQDTLYGDIAITLLDERSAYA